MLEENNGKAQSFHIDKETNYVTAQGIPELEGRVGISLGEGMAFFWCKGYELIIANTNTGKMRKMSTESGSLLVENKDIDYEAINKECVHGNYTASSKSICYGKLNRWDNFEKGLCAITWTIYPDGRYFEDEDGFGGQSNNEECVYAIINTDLEIIVPFRPIDDVNQFLKEMRSK